ncbi:MAG TPA: hypothetical protein VLZ83_07585 [Edaphocola sp.]|nr:hypothetical protein [Edaphocola sp.]
MKIIKHIFILVITLGLIHSCQNDDTLKDTTTFIEDNISQIEQSFSIANRPEQPTVLGEQKENPFSVENMLIALDSLKQYATEENSEPYLKSAETIEIYPTDLYVRFLPNDSIQYNNLTSNTTLTLFDTPLDYEIVQLGDYYKDSTITGDYTWLYTTVKPDYSFSSDIRHEVLSELFIIENSDDYTEEIIEDTATVLKSASGRTAITQDICNALYVISFNLTGNSDELTTIGTNEMSLKSTITNCTRKCIGKKWWKVCWTSCDTYYYPDGKIEIKTPTGDVGLKGVKVRMWRWFSYADAYTNASGSYYSKARFNKIWVGNSINYKIIYDCKRDNNSWKFKKTIAGAVCLWRDSYGMGYHSPNGHSMIFDTNSAYWGRGVLNNAIYDYIGYANQDGISLPPSNLDIADKNSNDFTSSAPLLKSHFNFSLIYNNSNILGAIGTIYGHVLFGWALPDLILRYNKTLDDYNKITATVWHELTHASHLQRMKSEKGYFWASDYWSQNIYQQAKNSIDDNYAYGNIGDDNWQIIALSEGWANYRAWHLCNEKLAWTKYLNIKGDSDAVTRYFTDRDFPRNYGAMFDELRAEGCSFSIMEKSLCTYSINGYKSNLVSKYPSKLARITEIIKSYE